VSGLRKFLALSWAARILLIEAWLHLGLARLALRVVPFRLISRRLGPQRGPVDLPTSSGVVPVAAQGVTRAIGIMSRHTPWESACLAQAIAGKFMLQRRGVPSLLVLGTRKDDAGNLTAHAWLRVGDGIALGGSEQGSYAVLAAFGELPV
jgi:hypothetical protein